jgi:hypothetical protein
MIRINNTVLAGRGRVLQADVETLLFCSAAAAASAST